MSILRLMCEVFGPGKPAFGITLIVIFSLIHGIARFTMMANGNHKYARQMKWYYHTACLVGGFGYTFYWIYLTVITPLLR